MARLILVSVYFLLSLLCIFPAPTYYMWYVSILTTEFSWLFLLIGILLLLWGIKVKRFAAIGTNIGVLALLLFLSPITRAYKISFELDSKFDAAFGPGSSSLRWDAGAKPFSFWRMFYSGSDKRIPASTINYSASKEGVLTLDFYKAQTNGPRPCVIVVHGGSWSAGDSKQLPELNSHLAVEGYNVASINYRLAPEYHWPAPVEDVHAVFDYLRKHAPELNIDTNNFVLLGRSAGGQIVLSAAYTLHERGLKGVINFYGPTDMVWGYANPANPMVLNTCKVMEDYLGGTYTLVPQNYVASSATGTIPPDAVPTLLIHGQNDPLVAYEHELRLAKKLKEHGAKYFLLTLPWATHGFDYTLNGPGEQISTYTIDRFLQAVTHSNEK
jgi:acetyl esterase/lipase